MGMREDKVVVVVVVVVRWRSVKREHQSVKGEGSLQYDRRQLQYMGWR
jgi:hypothetical protein